MRVGGVAGVAGVGANGVEVPLGWRWLDLPCDVARMKKKPTKPRRRTKIIRLKTSQRRRVMCTIFLCWYRQLAFRSSIVWRTVLNTWLIGQFYYSTVLITFIAFPESNLG